MAASGKICIIGSVCIRSQCRPCAIARTIFRRSAIVTPNGTLRVELPEKPDFSVYTGKTLEHVEQEYIIQVLSSKDWRISGPKGAAAILDMNPATLRSRMSQLGIRKPRNNPANH